MTKTGSGAALSAARAPAGRARPQPGRRCGRWSAAEWRGSATGMAMSRNARTPQDNGGPFAGPAVRRSICFFRAFRPQAAFFAAEEALSAAPSALAAALSPICWPASETVSVTSVALFCDTSAQDCAVRLTRSICFCTKSV